MNPMNKCLFNIIWFFKNKLIFNRSNKFESFNILLSVNIIFTWIVMCVCVCVLCNVCYIIVSYKKCLHATQVQRDVWLFKIQDTRKIFTVTLCFTRYMVTNVSICRPTYQPLVRLCVLRTHMCVATWIIYDSCEARACGPRFFKSI